MVIYVRPDEDRDLKNSEFNEVECLKRDGIEEMQRYHFYHERLRQKTRSKNAGGWVGFLTNEDDEPIFMDILESEQSS